MKRKTTMKSGKNLGEDTNELILTSTGNKIYELIKNIDNNKIFYYGIINEGKLDNYKIELKRELGYKNYEIFKVLFISILYGTKGYRMIEDILKSNENIGKRDLYKILSKKLGVASKTLANRVPSILQLSELFELFSVTNGKYSFNKENTVLKLTKLIKKFISRYIKKDSLKVNDMLEITNYRGFEIKISFGMGAAAKVTWISFLKNGNTTSNGIYPAILFNTITGELVTTYCISESNIPNVKWKNLKKRKIKDLNWKNYKESSITEIIESLDKVINKFLNNNNLETMKNLTSQEGLLLTSLLTKPFSILYGVSGTGKSRVVRELWEKLYGKEYKKYNRGGSCYLSMRKY